MPKQKTHSDCSRLQGLPKETVTWWFPMPHNFSRIFLLAVVICLIDVLESISIAKALAYKNRYELKCACLGPWHRTLVVWEATLLC